MLILMMMMMMIIQLISYNISKVEICYDNKDGYSYKVAVDKYKTILPLMDDVKEAPIWLISHFLSPLLTGNKAPWWVHREFALPGSSLLQVCSLWL